MFTLQILSWHKYSQTYDSSVTWHIEQLIVEPGPIGDGQPACEGVLSDLMWWPCDI